MNDLISRQAAIDTLNVGAELLRRVLDDADVVGAERAKYEWGLGLIESCISDMEGLSSAQPEVKPIDYRDCSCALLKMWIENVLTDSEYSRIQGKLNLSDFAKEGLRVPVPYQEEQNGNA